MRDKTRRYVRIGLWTIAVIIILVVEYRGLGENPTQSTTFAVNIGGPFEMTDFNGRVVTEKSYLGRPMAMYFGLTKCPDNCPAILGRMRTLLNKLEATAAARIQVIMVSLDPESDTPEVLKSYLSSIDARFIGLTGTQSQLARFANNYRVFHGSPPSEIDRSELSHSTGFYLFSSTGRFVDVIRSDEADEEAVAKLSRLLSRVDGGCETTHSICSVTALLRSLGWWQDSNQPPDTATIP